ncbi:hypothetical protein LR48_Vigan02g072100 [Vigna angularis]|uniref:Uncharacterized protein n=1 Tax=Phaseolus angularis TaxID=3914 RepID=A0A0L9TVR5_PHAAN|nr:hypothetical protein LR48_Vigan02g072100 [Vigna angularis]
MDGRLHASAPSSLPTEPLFQLWGTAYWIRKTALPSTQPDTKPHTTLTSGYVKQRNRIHQQTKTFLSLDPDTLHPGSEYINMSSALSSSSSACVIIINRLLPPPLSCSSVVVVSMNRLLPPPNTLVFVFTTSRGLQPATTT